MSVHDLSRELQVARAALERIEGLEVLREPEWDHGAERWALLCRLNLPNSHGCIPARTAWWVLIDPTYPWGAIDIYPALEGGIEQTYPHQLLNLPQGRRPWRSGKICVDSGVRALGPVVDPEPYSAADRLPWHLGRAMEWVAAADRGELILPGEPFELPDYSPASCPIVAFWEDPQTYERWADVEESYGYVTLAQLRAEPEVVVVRSFQNRDRVDLLSPAWGTHIQGTKDPDQVGLWVRLADVPRLAPWRAPLTWGELRSVLPVGLRLPDEVRSLLPPIRDGRPHYLLLGFPIPAVVGRDPQSMHWLALQLPRLGRERRDGFRDGELAAWTNDCTGLFRDEASVPWMRSENWSPADLSGRGSLPDALTGRRYLVIGSGALGSFVSEMLVRGGVTDVILSEGDTLGAGNLVRHTTTLDEVGLAKGAAVKARLNAASPHARVVALGAFPPSDPGHIELVKTADIVLDLTGSVSMPAALTDFEWEGEKLFISVSAGLGARRIFCFAAAGLTFPLGDFRDLTQPWLRFQIREAEGTALPREGIGCWHPVFPARVDDLWLLGAAAMRWIEDTVSEAPTSPELVVFEQRQDENGFAGVRRRTDVPDA